jgi:predicted membrane protein
MISFLFYAMVLDATIEGLDWLHRLYSAEEGIEVLKSVASSKLFYTLLIGQACLGTLVPLLLLGTIQLMGRKLTELNRRRVYFSSAVLVLIGVLAMRWNVVIGGQLFSKSLRGFMSYKMEFAGMEGWWISIALLALPFVILTVFIKFFLDRDLPTLENVVPGAPPRPDSPPAQA